MKTKAAVLTAVNTPFEIMELDLSGPRAGEVLIRYEASGMCHSDLHLTDGTIGTRFPIVPGHEGAGVVEEVGPAVTRVRPGDHVVCSFTPSCGRCRYCATGHQNLCDSGARATEGCMPDGTFRLQHSGTDIGAMCALGTFSEYGVVRENSVVRIDEYLPLDSAVLVSCGVPTGWGAAVYAGNVRPGHTVVVYGAGGVGINAVQGAAAAGAKNIVVVDPVSFKRNTALKLGATHVFDTAEQAHAAVVEMTWGQGADQALVATGVVGEDTVAHAFDAIGKGGTVVLIGLSGRDDVNVKLSGAMMVVLEKTIKGTMFGSANPQYDIPRLLGLYQAGDLKLDELITTRYSLEEINQGYQDLVDGKNIRGVVLPHG
jgi:S-(hydroxymethyl)glutathione dehydrogenase/alcohol dehydrogenase